MARFKNGKIRDISDVDNGNKADAAAARLTASNMGCEAALERFPKDSLDGYSMLYALWDFMASAMDEDESRQGIIDEFNSWIIDCRKEHGHGKG